MYLLVILTFLALDKMLAKPLLEPKECPRNLCGRLFNHVDAKMAERPAKCLESIWPFALVAYACNMHGRFILIEYKSPATKRYMERLV